MKKGSTLISVLILILLSYFSIRTLFIKGFFPMHDDTQIARVYEMKKSLAEGMFPVRWTQDLGYGYGYPIFNFYAPLPYYTGAIIDTLTNDSLLATKIMIALGLVLSGIFMYFLAREFWGELGGVLSGILYVYAPYHALNIYVRGAVSETFGYAFIPLAFFAIYKTWEKKKWKYVVIGSIALTGIISSHNLTALMTMPFLLILVTVLGFISFKKKDFKSVRPVLITLLLGLLISSFYWLPSLGELQFTNVTSQIGGGADFKDHFVCINQLWESTWGFGGSVPGCIDGLSFRIGKIHILLALLAIGGMVLVKNKRKQKIAGLFSLFILLSSIFLMLPVSEFVWQALSPMAFFQYPWRFLVFVSLGTSFLSGGVIWVLITQRILPITSNTSVGIASLLIVLSVFFYTKLFLPQYVTNATSTQLTKKEFINWNVSKISDEYMPKDFLKPKNVTQIPTQKLTTPEGIVQIQQDKTNRLMAIVTLPKEGVVHINIAYFPAWTAMVNGKSLEIKKSRSGMDITLPKGQNKLLLEFRQTPLEKLANFLSLAGISTLILGIIIERKKIASR